MTTTNPHHSRRWTILAILAIAQLMVVLDATIVNIALPSAQRALHVADSERQWIVTAYALAFGSLLLLRGRISDLLGRKWMFIVGLTGFATASAVGGAAQSFGMLAAARACQGAFGALLAPAALSLMTTTFTDADERNKPFGIWGAIAGGGGAIGLILGGVLTQTLSWRYSMYVNLVFATIAVTGALALLHNQPVTREHAVILELPWENAEGRAVAELTELVGARVVGEHLHPALRERFSVLQGDLTVVRDGQRATLRAGAKPPPTVQRAVFSALAAIAKRRGYRGTYPSLSRTTLAPWPGRTRSR